jgi:nucleoside-diphosphate-sugar epimerase
MANNSILIAGATGVVGAAAVEYFAGLPHWEVVAISRRPPPAMQRVRHVALDLTDAQLCRTTLANLPQVTHVLFAALYEKPDLIAGWRDPEQMAVNLAMLRNLLDGLEPAARGLAHIAILQGTKAYGSHIEPMRLPAKERWPRHPHENFYWLQEDLLRERQVKSTWTFSILRPQLVLGYAVSSPMNIVAAIGAYATVMRELGRPLAFPGGGRFLNGGSDSRLIARAAEFVGTHAVAANEIYNVVNGDVLVWQDIWPTIASHFGMQHGDSAPMNLEREMPAFEPVWRRVVERHGLRDLSLAGLVGSSWQFTDRAFAHGIAAPSDSVMSPIKLRRAGFADCFDTEDAILYWLAKMQAMRLLPA